MWSTGFPENARRNLPQDRFSGACVLFMPKIQRQNHGTPINSPRTPPNNSNKQLYKHYQSAIVNIVTPNSSFVSRAMLAILKVRVSSSLQVFHHPARGPANAEPCTVISVSTRSKSQSAPSGVKNPRNPLIFPFFSRNQSVFNIALRTFNHPSPKCFSHNNSHVSSHNKQSYKNNANH
jgi:hypothetical protein